MTKKQRDIQIILDKLWVEYSQLYQRVNSLDYFINYKMSAPDTLHPQDMETTMRLVKVSQCQAYYLPKQLEVMKTYLNILKERIDDLSKQFKESK